MNTATEIDTQMIALMKQMEALMKQKEALLAPPPAPTPTPEPEPTPTDEEKEKERMERMEAEIEHYITTKTEELETEAYSAFDWNEGSGDATINFTKRDGWCEEKLLEIAKEHMDEWVRQLTHYDDHGIEWEYDLDETDYTEIDGKHVGVQWNISLNWSFEPPSHALDYHSFSKPKRAMLEDPNAYDWDAFHAMTKK